MLDKILEAEPVWVAILIPSLIFPEYFWDAWAYPWAIALLFLFWPLRLIIRKEIAPASPLNWPALLLLGWAIVCTIVSPTPERSLLALGLIADGVALYFALVNSRLAQDYPLLLLLAFALAGLALAMLGPAMLGAIPNKLVEFDREIRNSQPIDFLGTGETINSNILAGSLLLIIPFMVALALRWDWGWRWLAILCAGAALLMIATLLLTQSRGSYLALALSLLLLCSLRWRWTLLLAGIVLVTAVSVSSWDRLLLFAEAIGGDGSIASLSGRREIWVGASIALLNDPLFGIGLGAFELTMPHLLPQTTLFQNAIISHAHNLFLQVGLDLGLPGLLCFSWLWVAALVVQIKTRLAIGEFAQAAQAADNRRQRTTRQRQKRTFALHCAIAEGALAATLAMLVHGIVDVASWGVKPAPLAWLILATTTLVYLPYATIHRTEADDPHK